MPLASALDRGDIKKVQETLLGKGYYKAPVDGILGPRNPRRDSPISEVGESTDHGAP